MDNKLSVKFESGLFEQTYKFRMGEGLETFTDLQKLVDQEFIQQVLEEMKTLNGIRNAALKRRFWQETQEEFEEIIWLLHLKPPAQTINYAVDRVLHPLRQPGIINDIKGAGKI